MEPQTGRIWRTASLAVLACVLVLVVALGSSRSADRGGRWTVLVVALAICLVCIALLVYALWSGRRRRTGRERASVTRAEMLVALVLVAVITSGILLGLLGRPTPEGTTTTTAAAVTKGGTSTRIPLPLYWWALAGLAALVVGTVAVLLVRRLRANRAPGAPGRSHFDSRELAPDESDRDAQVLAAVEYSLEEIQRETDPRRAVIRAYVKMGQILAAHGLGRLTHEAPNEYLNRALAGIQLSRAAAERLTDLFVRARYSSHVVDPELKQDAIAALTAVRDELQAVPQ